MKMLFAAVVAAVFVAVAPAQVFAQSNEAILQRLAALEKENATVVPIRGL